MAGRGLVRGITSKLAAAKDTIVNFGSSVKGWFTDLLTRIGRFAGQVLPLLARPPVPNVPAWPGNGDARSVRVNRQQRGATGQFRLSITVHVEPIIHIDSKHQNAGQEIQNVLGMRVRDLEQMLARGPAKTATQKFE